MRPRLSHGTGRGPRPRRAPRAPPSRSPGAAARTRLSLWALAVGARSRTRCHDRHRRLRPRQHARRPPRAPGAAGGRARPPARRGSHPAGLPQRRVRGPDGAAFAASRYPASRRSPSATSSSRTSGPTAKSGSLGRQARPFPALGARHRALAREFIAPGFEAVTRLPRPARAGPPSPAAPTTSAARRAAGGSTPAASTASSTPSSGPARSSPSPSPARPAKSSSGTASSSAT